MVSCSAESDLQSVRESIISISDPWDSTNSEIAKFEPALPQSNPDEEELLAAFPAPQPSKFDMTEAATESHLSPINYSERLHQLLYIEEMSQRAALDGFNALLKVCICTCICSCICVCICIVFVSVFVVVSGPARLEIPPSCLPFKLEHRQIRSTR